MTGDMNVAILLKGHGCPFSKIKGFCLLLAHRKSKHGLHVKIKIFLSKLGCADLSLFLNSFSSTFFNDKKVEEFTNLKN